MVQLVDSDIKTREVLGWKGVHLLHFMGSSVSQKLRIFLNLKGIPWHSHPVDLPLTRTSSRGFSASIRAGWCRFWCMTAPCTSRATISSSTSNGDFPHPAHCGRPRERHRSLAQARRRPASRPSWLSFRFVFTPPGPPNPGRCSKATPRTAPTVRGHPASGRKYRSNSGSARPGRFHRRAGTRLGVKVPCRLRRSRQGIDTHPYLMGEV